MAGAQSHQIFVSDHDQSYVATFPGDDARVVSRRDRTGDEEMALSRPRSVLDDGALRRLCFPARRSGISEMRKQSCSTGNILARPDTSGNADTSRHHRRRDDGGRDRHGHRVDHPFFGPDADHNGVADRIVFQWDFADNDADAKRSVGTVRTSRVSSDRKTDLSRCRAGCRSHALKVYLRCRNRDLAMSSRLSMVVAPRG